MGLWIRKAGYATNPSYPEILIKSIEKYNLEQYTLDGLNEVPQFVAEKNQIDPEDSLSTLFADSSLTAPINLTINGLKVLLCPKGYFIIGDSHTVSYRPGKIIIYK